MSTHCLYTAFDPATLHFGALDKNKKGGKIVLVSQNASDGAKKRIRIQTPTLSLPFNVNVNTGPDNQIQSYTMDVSFRGYESDPAVADFLARMRKVDEVVLNTAVERGTEWFGKSTKKDAIPLFQKKLVKDSGNTDKQGNPYPPTMRIKIPVVNGNVEAQLFDENRRQIDVEEFIAVAKGSSLKMIIDLSSVWFINANTFGVSWRLTQAMVVSRPNKLDGFSFIDDDSDMAAPEEGGPLEATHDPPVL